MSNEASTIIQGYLKRMQDEYENFNTVYNDLLTKLNLAQTEYTKQDSQFKKLLTDETNSVTIYSSSTRQNFNTEFEKVQSAAQAKILNISQVPEELDEFIKLANLDLEGVRNQLNEISQNVAAIKDEANAQIDSINRELPKVTEAGQKAIEDMNKVVNQVTASGQTLQQQINELDLRLSGIVNNQSNISKDITAIQETNKAINASQEALLKLIDKTDDRIDQINQQIGDIVKIQTDIDTLKINKADKIDVDAQLATIMQKLLNPEMFRYVDGVALSDDECFKQALIYAYTNGNELHLYQDYTIKSVKLTGVVTIHGHDNNIYEADTGNVFIEVTGSGRVMLKDLKIRGTNYNYGLLNNDGVLNLQNVSVDKFRECNVRYVKKTINGYGDIDSLECQLSKIGLDLSGTDVKVKRYQGWNCLTHIIVKGGGCFLDNCHGWNMVDEVRGDYVTGSIFIDAYASFIMNNCYADTVETALKLPTGEQYTLINSNNFIYFLNRSFYPNGVTAPKLFRNLENFSGKLSVINVQVDNSSWRDASGNATALYDAPLIRDRITIEGLTNNGFVDKDFINSKSGDLYDYLTGETSAYFSPYSRKYFAHRNQRRILIKASLSKSIPNNSIAYTANFKAPFDVFGHETIGRAYILNETTVTNLELYVGSGTVTVTNKSGNTISAGDLVITLEHFVY